MTDCIVLGAGIVGVSTALALQERGRQVVLLDRKLPGQETSYGNAGVIQAEAVEPYAFPRKPGDILSVILRRGNDVNWRWPDMPELVLPLWRYFRASAPERYIETAAAYARLILRATSDHAHFIGPAGADDLIERQGWQVVYRSQRVFEEAAQTAHRLEQAYGVPSRVMSGSELAKSEPALRCKMAGAVHWTSPWTCCAPGELVERYAALFVQRGGRIVTGDATTLHHISAGWRVTVEEGQITAQDAVVALGPWSPTLLAGFGYQIPMIYKRGYHRNFAVQAGPRLPTLDIETATLMSPMKAGLRVLTGAHLARPGARPALQQITRAITVAGEFFELGEPVEKTPWMGTRPCMPDMLPVVGAAHRHPGLWFNFGHGHQGFTLGPTTGLLLAERMCETAVNPAVAPLAPSLRQWAG